MNHFCGIRLSTFSIIIGWINLMSAVFSTILLCVAFVYLDDVVKAAQDYYNEPNNDVNIKTAVIVTLCVYFTTSVANVIASALLIIGSIKERHLLLAPWLLNTYIIIFFSVLNFIYVTYISIAQNLEAGAIIMHVLTMGISLAFEIIIWNAIYSHFKQLRANQDMQQRLLPTSCGPQYSHYTKMPPTSQ